MFSEEKTLILYKFRSILKERISELIKIYGYNFKNYEKDEIRYFKNHDYIGWNNILNENEINISLCHLDVQGFAYFRYLNPYNNQIYDINYVQDWNLIVYGGNKIWNNIYSRSELFNFNLVFTKEK